MARSAPSRLAVAVAALTVALGSGAAPAEFRLLPAGTFRAVDGRPEGVDAWHLDAALAAKIVAAVDARESDLVIDYEHQTLRAAENGKPAPAAGWFKRLEWREGDGLYVVDARWTEEAAALIASGSYRFVSPVFAWNRKTGAVVAVKMAALTNDPGLDGLTDLAALAASLVSSDQPEQESDMDELLERCRWLLNLPITATAEEVSAELQKLIDQLKGGNAQAAASFDLAKYLADLGTEVAALKSQAPDPAKYVEVATLTAVRGELATATAELATLKAEKSGAEVDAVVSAALAAGKLTPATEAHARKIGATDLAALKGFVDALPVVVVPDSTQTGGTKPAGGSHQHADVDVAVMKALGLTAEQFAAGKQEV